jgi:exodeoxyribonuclease V beta subunit
MTRPQPLDPLTLPLWGSRLIEASAGTGKTWTIAALYLRLVLGHGDPEQDHGFGRPLIPSEILVMTFTRAATRELSDRIRARLLEAVRCFRGEVLASDPLMTQLLDSHPEGAARANAAWRLATAAESMDEAAVHTIDAWCQRMLREHAFDSGCLFDEELTGNELGMVGEAAQDYWRQQVYPLAGEALDTALAVWKDIATLTADARALKDQVLRAEAGTGSLADCIAKALAEQQTVLVPLKAGWAERAWTMLQWLDGQTGHKTSPFNGNKLRKASYAGWLTALAVWAESPALVQPDINETGRKRLVPQGMEDALKAGCTVVLPEGFAAFETLLRDLAKVPVVVTRLRLHAAVQMQARLAALKKATGSFGFADMLTRLDHALDPDAKPDAAERLRIRILTQYPVALIDEFQDTAPVQARIFERLYRLADNDRQAALLLIGDPKQSIYGFRGADIHSYLKARKATAGRHYVLDTNHRSTASVVAAVNHLLHACELREAGEGAFRYRSPPATNGEATENPLPFLPVQARGRDERFREGHMAVPAMTLAIDTELRNKNGSMRAFAARCAERITCLLNDPDAGFEEDGKPLARLRPADVAILVRTGKEAAAVQRELQRRGVASV